MYSSWVQVDISLLRNPKLIMCAKRNKMSEMEVLGGLVKLWAYSFEFGKVGSIPHPELLKDQIWEGKDLFNMYLESGFIDKKRKFFYVHDWEDKYSAVESYRALNAKRQREFRQRKKEEEQNKKYKELQKKLHPEIADEI